MKATELRIGNLFIDKYSKKVIPVLELLRNGNIVFDFECFGIWQAEPIPLTEEWLLKFGFEKNDNKLIKYIDNDDKYYNINLMFNKFPLVFEIDGNIAPLHNIKHVNQLQNLYFALTGEELQTI